MMKYLKNKNYILTAVVIIVIAAIYIAISSSKKVITIQISSPLPNNLVHSPITVQGKARGSWFFEGSFPIILLDANKKIITTSIATSKGNWMTTEFIPFQATLTYNLPTTDTGFVLFKRDNPSGLPKNDIYISVPVRFK